MEDLGSFTTAIWKTTLNHHHVAIVYVLHGCPPVPAGCAGDHLSAAHRGMQGCGRRRECAWPAVARARKSEGGLSRGVLGSAGAGERARSSYWRDLGEGAGEAIRASSCTERNEWVHLFCAKATWLEGPRATMSTGGHAGCPGSPNQTAKPP
jgi:hypothetical protein